MKTVMKVVIDNKACNGLKGEWGLSIVVEYKGKKILVDAGASDLFIENMQKMDIDIQDIDYAMPLVYRVFSGIMTRRSSISEIQPVITVIRKPCSFIAISGYLKE